MGNRVAIVVVTVLALMVLGLFLVAGALDPPARLKTRPATATPKGGVPTVAPR